MRVLICHERFLFRFGADRALMLIGRGLSALGHEIVMMANGYDRAVLDGFANRIIQTPGETQSYLDLNEFTAEWLRQSWGSLFPAGSAPDVVIVGGWPYIAAIPVFRDAGCRVIFNDFGVVPAEGYADGMRITLGKLRRLRREFLPRASSVVAISEFIAESQSQPDAQGVPVHSILLGADHMQQRLWQSSNTGGASSGAAPELLRKLRDAGRRVVLCLGRFEPGCYKNSDAALSLADELKKTIPEVAVLLLAEKAAVPPKLRDSVFCVGFPDDENLTAIMRQSDLGVSMSLWEGFNLPLAEMQWLDKQVLVYRVGAHAEVVAHPWYLCSDGKEMVAKAELLLHGLGPAPEVRSNAFRRFRETLTWQRCIEKWHGLLEKGVQRVPRRNLPTLLIDVTSATRDPANSGVIRVARRLSAALQRHIDPVFVVWDAATASYAFPTRSEYDQLGSYGGPALTSPIRLSPETAKRVSVDGLSTGSSDRNSWLLIPEVLDGSEFAQKRNFARRHAMRVAAIFYDAIPVLRPELCSENVTRNHPYYMRGLAECDVVLPISNFSSRCLAAFWSVNGITGPELQTNVLPGEFGGVRRTTISQPGVGRRAQMLCVSTLEPRKGHKTLLRACQLLEQQHPELDWQLTLVGNRYAGSFEIADHVEAVCRENRRVRWLGIVSDEQLAQLYRDAAFTIYPSELEGFGLPILESIWNCRPCICSSNGVMGELATEGGCLTTDVRRPELLASAIYRLASDAPLWIELSSQAAARKLKTWNECADVLLNALCHRRGAAPKPETWREMVYGSQALLNEDLAAETLALIGILTKIRPVCSIGIGLDEPSAGLLAQHSKSVFCIGSPSFEACPIWPNVLTFGGETVRIFRLMMSELKDAGLEPQVILVNGALETGDLKKLFSDLLASMPSMPVLMVVSCSGGQGCRAALRETDWTRSGYLHEVEMDLVPSRDPNATTGLSVVFLAPRRSPAGFLRGLVAV